MGGIIVALVGVALLVGALVLRRNLRKCIEQCAFKVADLKAQKAAANGYDRASVQQKIDAIQEGRSALTWARRSTWLGVVIGLILVALTVVVQVPVRNVGAVDAFGRPVGTKSNGIGVTWPWESVTIYDATVQTLVMEGGGDDGKPRQKVRIMNGTATAGMDVVVEWRIDPTVDIQTLHKDWRNFESLEARVVKPRLATSLNAVFETYDPLIAQREKGATPISLGSKEPELKRELQMALPKEILVRSVMIAFVEYPPNVQKALDDMQVELANTQVALQQQVTAAAQKLAIETLASAKMTPEAFAQQCLIVTERLAQQGKPISVAWTCVGTTNPFGLAVTGK